MNCTEIRPWQLVASSAGRDLGQRYLVRSMRDGFAMVVDGQRRTMGSPKRKNLRHLLPLPVVAVDLAESDLAGRAISDEQVRLSIEGLSLKVEPWPEENCGDERRGEAQ